MEDKESFTIMATEAIAALEALVMEDKPLNERLIESWTSHLSKLYDLEMPPEFQKRFNYMLESVPPHELIIDAIDKLSPAESRILAQRIVHFVLDIEMMIGAKR